ncbi:MAG TPA: ATP-grasp domain-containing protein [Pirellulales bacterium]|nr:ATP-grasp domain-containing protein [Pirellulales bacterium]
MASLLILGASVRAAAQSAARAGFTPICGDLFGDADLRSQHHCNVVRRYPYDLERIAQGCPAGPWLFTGGLENQPALVGRISAGRTLYGNPPEVLRCVRDPFVLGRSFSKWGIAYPECRSPTDPPPRDGGWLLKHRGSSGGQLVRVWDAGSSFPPCGRRSGWFFQRRVTGVSCGAVYVVAGGNAEFIGITEQLLIADEPAHPFRYAGSLGPLPVSAEQDKRLKRLGRALAAEFGLRGLFGVDLVINGDAIWPVEINPRYTASIEVLERATGAHTIALHVAACEHGVLSGFSPPSAAAWCGKLVVYASCELCVSAEKSAELLRENQGLVWPTIADIPVAGTKLRAGQPVVTVMAEAESRDALLALLIERRRHIEQRLFGSDCE